ncbi:hypothetical protein D9619_008803 [Psilocybe cf. subviscida]|uniref:Transcription elongation factor n=1 Tax=Psilocybe cf. subviscida TaxID=2480587 RepID=A0A8H5B9U2_9AGAR|nr:hypothetical protein D9619_008803 [Psilocybe cf. subviscida]
MSNVIELKKTIKQLQSAVNDQEIVEILKVLKNVPAITEGTLRESKAGLAVGKLRSHKTKAVSEAAKELVKQWKTAVEKDKATKKPANGAATETKPPAAATSPVTPGVASAAASTRTAKTDGVAGKTSDKVRDKCVEMLYDALCHLSSAPVDLILSKAHGVEKAVFNTFGSTNGDYKNKIRSLFVNLKDKANPGLRVSIVEGTLAPERFAKMTSAEMASEERRAADQKIKDENFFKSLSAAEKQAETDAFQCSRCKQRKCIYRQQQTRSADEPMTTFVTCTVCQNKWKFS